MRKIQNGRQIMFQCDRGYSMIEPGPSGATCVAGREGSLGCRGTICLPRNYQIFSIGFHYRPLVSTTTTEVEIFQQEKLDKFTYYLFIIYKIKMILMCRCVEGSHPKFMRTKSSRRKKRWINTKELFPHQSVELINGGKNRREEKNILNSSKINKEEEKPWL